MVFRDIDESGDGIITEDVLNNVLANPKCQAYFQTLDLDVNEGSALFHLLDNGRSELHFNAFDASLSALRRWRSDLG